MMSYEQMSDFEINKLVAAALGFKYVGRASIDGADGVYHAVEMGGCRTSLRDYCGNMACAWPIINGLIVSGCIVQILSAGVVITIPGGGQIKSMDSNQLRAAMIAFLMIRDDKCQKS